MFEILGLFLGFFLLIKGANYLVEGACSIALQLKISEMVVGLTIVSIGTSAPELVFNTIAVYLNNFDLAVGNILGSNLSNLLLIFGIASFLTVIPFSKYLVRVDILLNIASISCFLIFAFVINYKSYTLSRLEGVIFLVIFFCYYYFLFKKDRKSFIKEEISSQKTKSLKVSIFLIFIGIVFLFLGGRLIVYGSLFLCDLFALSEGFVGLTVVALGTSFPELVTTIIAVKKKKIDLIVGNIFGSNICNIFLIFGASALVKPIEISSLFLIECLLNMVICLLLIGFCFIGKAYMLTLRKGFFLLFIYGVYIYYLFLRG